MNDILRSSAADMARAVRDREVSPVELVQAHIDRAEEVARPQHHRPAALRAGAGGGGQRPRRSFPDAIRVGPLHGVPFTAKECIEVAGMPCLDGSKIFEGNVSTQDATVERNLRQAGAILIGKTNIPEFAIHYDSNNLVYGATHNPHNPERLPVGGSSGGEGAALATGITPFGVGSDYGGSIRVPAHFNGIVGAAPRALGRPVRRSLPSCAIDDDPALVGDRSDGALRGRPPAPVADLREAGPGSRPGRDAPPGAAGPA